MKGVYKKEALAAEIVTKRAVFNGFSTEATGKKGILAAVNTENCDCSDGALRRGIGFFEYREGAEKNPFPDDPKDPPAAFALLPYTEGGERKKTMMYVSRLGISYLYNARTNGFDFALKVFPDVPAILPVCGEDGTEKLAFCSEEGIWTYDKTSKFTSVYASAAGNVACVCRERIFFVKKPFTLCFCAPLAIKQWEDSADEGGEISFPSEKGGFVALATLKETVYAFREKGIVKIEGRGAARDFSAEELPYGGGRIFGDSAGVCGEKIFFLAEDGLYAFDGAHAARIAEKLSIFPAREGQVCEHGTVEGKFLLRYTDRSGQSKLLVWDAQRERGYFSTLDATALSDTQNLLLCMCGGEIRHLGGGGALTGGKSFRFETELGIAGRSVWKKLTLKGCGTCTAEAENEYEIKRFTVAFERGVAEMTPILKGERFMLRLFPDEKSEIRGVEAEFAALRR